MKSIIKSALLFSIIVITVKCDEQISSYNKEIYAITGYVYDRMIEDTSPNPMAGVKVFLIMILLLLIIVVNLYFIKKREFIILKLFYPTLNLILKQYPFQKILVLLFFYTIIEKIIGLFMKIRSLNLNIYNQDSLVWGILLDIYGDLGYL